MASETLFVCVNCPHPAPGATRQEPGVGSQLLDAIRGSLASRPELASQLTVGDVVCMGGCDKPCVVALAAPYKETLLFGGMDVANAGDILDCAQAFIETAPGQRIAGASLPSAMRGGNFLVRVPATARRTEGEPPFSGETPSG